MQGVKLDTITVEELFEESTSGALPVLIDIVHDHITWGENDEDQENGHLRLINSNVPVRYNGHKYMPCSFDFTRPSEDGKKIGNATISISALDQRIIEIIREIKDDEPVAVIEAFFMKEGNDFLFSKLYHYDFLMKSVDWSDVSANFELIFDNTMQQNVPKDLGTIFRCPGANV